MANELTIWSRLIAAGMTVAGAAGVMGNLYAESALNPRNLQQSYEKSLGYTDDSYTSAVDSGRYTNFVYDAAGYGLAQWTYKTRKKDLLDYAKSKGTSIGDLNMQLDFLINELRSSYKGVWNVITSTTDVRTASNRVLFDYESPADQGDSVQNTRYKYSMKYYDMFKNGAAQTTKKSVEEIAQEILQGLWGNGDKRKDSIIKAGYDYTAVQNAVNNLVSKKTIDVTTIVDGVTYSGLLTAT